MTQVMMICPKTKNPFRVGMDMDRGTLERTSMNNNSMSSALRLAPLTRSSRAQLDIA